MCDANDCVHNVMKATFGLFRLWLVALLVSQASEAGADLSFSCESTMVLVDTGSSNRVPAYRLILSNTLSRAISYQSESANLPSSFDLVMTKGDDGWRRLMCMQWSSSPGPERKVLKPGRSATFLVRADRYAVEFRVGKHYRLAEPDGHEWDPFRIGIVEKEGLEQLSPRNPKLEACSPVLKGMMKAKVKPATERPEHVGSVSDDVTVEVR